MSLCQFLALAFVWIALTGCGGVQAVAAQSARIELPAESEQAMTREYGNYEGVVAWDSMMNELQKMQVVCIGEAHYDARDMETAFEIVRALASKKKIALAVERFSYDMQPALDELNALDNANAREAKLDTLLENESYQTVWGNGAWSQEGFPANTPSRPVFEAMVKWAARARVPIIALDFSLAERGTGTGDDLVQRNEFWKRELEIYRTQHARDEYQIVVIGGINHMTNAPDSFPSKMKTTASAQVISIGQRDAMYGYLGAAKVAKVAADNHMDDLVIRRPQFALVDVKGVAKFPNPPDYWIALHAPTRE